VNGGVLGLDRDALLLFEVHGVHGALLDLLVGAIDAALLEEFIDEGRLAMVNVCDDGDVADVLVHVRDVACGTAGCVYFGKRVSLPGGRARRQGRNRVRLRADAKWSMTNDE
jgi:hypothetical protein